VIEVKTILNGKAVLFEITVERSEGHVRRGEDNNSARSAKNAKGKKSKIRDEGSGTDTASLTCISNLVILPENSPS